MKKKGILLIAVILLSTAGLVHAQKGELTGSVDVTFLSKFVWRGFDIYDDKSAIHPSIDLDMYGTGLGINIGGYRANSGEFENLERWDYSLYYNNSLFETRFMLQTTELVGSTITIQITPVIPGEASTCRNCTRFSGGPRFVPLV